MREMEDNSLSTPFLECEQDRRFPYLQEKGSENGNFMNVPNNQCFCVTANEIYDTGNLLT